MIHHMAGIPRDPLHAGTFDSYYAITKYIYMCAGLGR